MITATGLVLLAWLLPASGPASQPVDLPEWRALVEAETRWRARQPPRYEFSIDMTCECRRPSGVPSRFRVARGEPEPLPELDAPARQFYDTYNTVEKLFAVIRRAIVSDAHRVSVRYDPELGYPVWADIDPQREVKDDELFLRVRGFRVRPIDLQGSFSRSDSTRSGTSSPAVVDSRP